MKGSPCLFSSAAAIRRVFISNAVSSETSLHFQRLLLPAVAAPKPAAFATPPSRRHFSAQPARQLQYKKKRTDSAKDEKKVIADRNIKHTVIQIRGDDGRLSEPCRTWEVLRDLNLERETLILVAEPARDGGNGPEFPICRIADRQAEEAKKAERRAIEKAQKVVSKELEFNWAIAQNDLKFKTSRLKGFLEKGYRVDVALRHPKVRGKRKATKEEAQGVFKAVNDVVKEVPGVSNYKPNDGDVGGTLMMYLQGPSQKATAAAAAAAPKASAETAEE